MERLLLSGQIFFPPGIADPTIPILFKPCIYDDNVDIKLLLIVFFSVLSNGNPDAKRLFDDLLSSYNKLVRPVINVTDPVTVKFKLKLSQLIDVVGNLVAQILTHFDKSNCRICGSR